MKYVRMVMKMNWKEHEKSRDRPVLRNCPVND
jgi:hypothetical protein